MSGYPGGGGGGHQDYDDGYGHQGGHNTDSYYQDEQHGQYYDHDGYDNNANANHDGYYDQS